MSAVPATRCASIDVGSNTTALLVADLTPDALVCVESKRVFTMLGSESGPTGISPEKISEVVAATQDLIGIAETLGCSDRIELVATHVVREAHNGHELETAIERATGRTIEVIDSDQEARFSFIGATGGIDRLRGLTAVVDAGGGSTEFSYCSPGEQPITASFPIGSATLKGGNLSEDPPLVEEIARAREVADRAFAELHLPEGCQVALAVGGGASTARQLTGGVLDAPGIARVLALATSMPSTELAERFQLEPRRARLLASSLTILGAIVERIGIGMEVGRGGLREGLLIDRYR